MRWRPLQHAGNNVKIRRLEPDPMGFEKTRTEFFPMQTCARILPRRQPLAPSLLFAAITCLEPAWGREHTPAASPQESDRIDGVAIEAAYTSDLWANLSGGTDTGVRYLDNIDLQFTADLDALDIVRNTSIFIYGLYNNGAAFSGDLAGDAQVVSNIEAPVEAVRLYEAWIEHEFWGGSASLRAGLYDVNSEFDALSTSSVFINSAHGIGSDIGQTGETGPSIFPITSLGARLSLSFSDNWTLRFAALDGSPGDPTNLKRTTVKFNDGAFIMSEGEYATERTKLIAGHWRYTAAFDDFDGGASRGNNGFYIRGERVLAGNRLDGEDGLSVFARYGTASANHNDFNRFYAAGLVWRSALAKGDALGLALAIAQTSPEKRRTDPVSARRETAIEVTYAIPMTDWLSLQPDIQFIIDPGARATRKPAVAFGLRTVFSIDWGK